MLNCMLDENVAADSKDEFRGSHKDQGSCSLSQLLPLTGAAAKFGVVENRRRGAFISAADRKSDRTGFRDREPGRTMLGGLNQLPLIGGGVSYASSIHRDYANGKQIHR